MMSSWSYGLIAVAALAGASGVIEAAAAAHRIADPHLGTASHMLMLAAAASVAFASVGRSDMQDDAWFLVAATILLSGSILFSTDLSVRAFTGQRLFPFAAPIGGTLMILGWLVAAVGAGFRLARSRRH